MAIRPHYPPNRCHFTMSGDDTVAAAAAENVNCVARRSPVEEWWRMAPPGPSDGDGGDGGTASSSSLLSS